jgi:hypothetical protein
MRGGSRGGRGQHIDPESLISEMALSEEAINKEAAGRVGLHSSTERTLIGRNSSRWRQATRRHSGG